MFSFVGYDLFSDQYCLNSPPSIVDGIKNTMLTNAIFDHLNASTNTSIPVSTDIPEWDYGTIYDMDFNGNLSGGNIDFVLSQISSVRIKRRFEGEFAWVTLEEIPINQVADLGFTYTDRLNKTGVTYEYAIVPVLNDVEGNYVTNSVYSEFYGVYIGNNNNIYRFMYDVGYGTTTTTQQTGTFDVLGRKYPIVVSNADLQYETGSVTGYVLNDDYDKNGVFDRPAIVQKRKEVVQFLTDKTAKILKDWNGNMWLCTITGSVNSDYVSYSGMGVPSVTFSWVEIGDADNFTDLYNAGLIERVE